MGLTEPVFSKILPSHRSKRRHGLGISKPKRYSDASVPVHRQHKTRMCTHTYKTLSNETNSADLVSLGQRLCL